MHQHLLKTNEEYREHAPLTYSDLELDRLKPFIRVAQTSYLRELLGAELLQQLLDLHEPATDTSGSGADSGSGSGSDCVDDGWLEQLLPVVQNPLAFLALFEGFPFLEIRIGTDGVHQIGQNGGEMQPIYSEQRIAAMTSLLRLGMNALEEMLLWLEANKAHFSCWAQSAERTKQFGHIIPTAAVLTDHWSQADNKRLTFRALQQRFLDIERRVVRPLLGDALMDALLGQLLSNTVTNANKQLLTYLRPMVAKMGVARAMPSLTMQIEAFGIYSQFIEKNEKNVKTHVAANVARFAEVRKELENDAAEEQLSLIKYMTDNPTLYPLYADTAADTAAADATRNAAWDEERKGNGIQYF